MQVLVDCFIIITGLDHCYSINANQDDGQSTLVDNSSANHSETA